MVPRETAPTGLEKLELPKYFLNLHDRQWVGKYVRYPTSSVSDVVRFIEIMVDYELQFQHVGRYDLYNCMRTQM